MVLALFQYLSDALLYGSIALIATVLALFGLATTRLEDAHTAVAFGKRRALDRADAARKVLHSLRKKAEELARKTMSPSTVAGAIGSVKRELAELKETQRIESSRVASDWLRSLSKSVWIPLSAFALSGLAASLGRDPAGPVAPADQRPWIFMAISVCAFAAGTVYLVFTVWAVHVLSRWSTKRLGYRVELTSTSQQSSIWHLGKEGKFKVNAWMENFVVARGVQAFLFVPSSFVRPAATPLASADVRHQERQAEAMPAALRDEYTRLYSSIVPVIRADDIFRYEWHHIFPNRVGQVILYLSLVCDEAALLFEEIAIDVVDPTAPPPVAPSPTSQGAVTP